MLLTMQPKIFYRARQAGHDVFINGYFYNVNRPGFPRHSPGSLRNAFQTLPVTADC